MKNRRRRLPIAILALFASTLPVSALASSAPAIAQEDEPPSALPIVTATATDAIATENEPADTGAIEFVRTGETTAALDVNYVTRYGTASAGRDYRHPAENTPNGWLAFTATATIPAGASSVDLPIAPLNDNQREGADTVVFTISHKGEHYLVGDPNEATVTISDDESPAGPAAPTGLAAWRVSDTQINLAWADQSTNESGFTIERKPEGASEFDVLASTPPGTNVYSDATVPIGAVASYRVAARNDQATSAFSNAATAAALPPATPAWQENVPVAREPDRFKGWPVNGGMWNWGDEMVVMYEDTELRRLEGTTHSIAFDKPTSIEQARSTDGGTTWSIEKRPITKPGAPGFPADGLYGPAIAELPAPVDFRHPDFALHVRYSNKDYGNSYWYYSLDRAKTWNGPFALPNFGRATINARTGYVVDSSNEIALFLSGTHETNTDADTKQFVVRSDDGGMTWQFVANVGDLGIQASPVRLSSTTLLVAIRNSSGVEILRSTDNGASWSARSKVTEQGSPGSLSVLPDGRLVVTYGYRDPPYGVRTRVSSDEGATWSDEVVLRADGGSFDLGYTKDVLRPDGKIVTAYYFNSDNRAERTIEATIWDPVAAFASLPPPSSTTTPPSSTATLSPAGTTYLSDLTPSTTPVNGYGPYERDRPNGGDRANDKPLGSMRLGTTTYAKGLGVHARSELTYSLGGNYDTFSAVVGLDEEVGNGGSVIFKVFRNGSTTPAFTSALLTGASAPVPVSIPVTGATQLKLVVETNGDKAYDHADWADAKLVKAGGTTTTTSPPTTTTTPPTVQPGLTPVPPNSPALTVERTFVTGLTNPWDLGFIADGTMFFTQRTGEISVRLPDGTVRVLQDVPDVVTAGEGGMLGLAVDPSFATNRRIYTCAVSSVSGSNDVRVMRWQVNAALDALENRADIVTGLPVSSGRHSGCRPRFGPDGFLYVGTGDAAQGTNPQSGSSLGGKVLRVTTDGTAAAGNAPPSGFNPRIYNYGHRNVQGIAFRPSDSLGVSIEHGPDVDDEVNRIVNGANFGWDPVPGYNETVPMTDTTKFPNAVQAIWRSGTPTTAPSGATFLSGAQWKSWDGALAMTNLKGKHLRLLFFDANGVLTRQSIAGLGADVPRLRSAVQGPDGNLYVSTDVGAGGGAIWKLTPS